MGELNHTPETPVEKQEQQHRHDEEQRESEQSETLSHAEKVEAIRKEIADAVRQAVENEPLANLLYEVLEAAKSESAEHLQDAATVQHGLNELHQLSRGNEAPEHAIPFLKQTHTILEGIRLALGRGLAAIFNQWTGQRWDLEDSKEIASAVDELAKSLDLRLLHSDPNGTRHLMHLRCQLSGKNPKPAFELTSKGGAGHQIIRSSRDFPACVLVTAGPDKRRS